MKTSQYLYVIKAIRQTASFCRFDSYYRQLKVIKDQLKVSKPLHKHLWQSIIKQKICNQAEVCRLANIPSNLLELHKQVNSGDTANVEAVAASIYFKLLFGRDFGRQKECGINACLNYGYKMLQYSVYARLCNGIDNAESHFARLSKVTPQTGSIRCLIVTEKQYASMRILVGKRLSADKPSEYVQLTFL